MVTISTFAIEIRRQCEFTRSILAQSAIDVAQGVRTHFYSFEKRKFARENVHVHTARCSRYRKKKKTNDKRRRNDTNREILSPIVAKRSEASQHIWSLKLTPDFAMFFLFFLSFAFICTKRSEMIICRDCHISLVNAIFFPFGFVAADAERIQWVERFNWFRVSLAPSFFTWSQFPDDWISIDNRLKQQQRRRADEEIYYFLNAVTSLCRLEMRISIRSRSRDLNAAFEFMRARAITIQIQR